MSGVILVAVAICLSCTEIQRPTPEPFYAESTPPSKQEFRWSNGKLPKSFDPARAAAAPETDIVRALFEGLTETDPRTLQAVPAAADRWSSSNEFRVWTFHLRRDARWSNGENVTAFDFVSSWKRLASLGDKAAHPELFQNIVGLAAPKPASAPSNKIAPDFLRSPASGAAQQLRLEIANTAQPKQAPPPYAPNANTAPAKKDEAASADPRSVKFGVEATDASTLKVSLLSPDKDFPKLVANPIFRPVYGDATEFETDPLDDGVVTNGAFSVATVSKDGIVLSRSDSYWNAGTVSLDSVRFVPKESAETALDAYRKGEIDAVTNAEFEPLILKLLAPYDDFRQTTHSALNFYEFNTANPPFDDRRVREALAIAIDRDRLTAGEMEGAAQPASSFLPIADRSIDRFLLDVDLAKQLLEKAGFPRGEGFPRIRLLVNRNDTQQRIARAIARMWKQNLNLDTEVLVKDPAEIDAIAASGEYDLMRRGIVLPTADESVSMAAIFGLREMRVAPPPVPVKEPPKYDPELGEPPPPLRSHGPTDVVPAEGPSAESLERMGPLTEETALYDVQAIPLYFPMSYSLVKPYVKGFETNSLDAPLLREISIDNDWQPASAR
jgi:oligopeptide transport system substrate-binding protein